MRVAIVHDWLTNFGGSERCVEAFLEIYPEAHFYTSVWDKKAVKQFEGIDIRTSFLQKMPGSKKHHAFYLNLMPLAFEKFDLSDYDLVISSSHACSKGVITRPGAVHICYCYTPTRYLWDFWHDYIHNPSYFGIFNSLIKVFAPFAATYLRVWDRTAAERVDNYIAISDYIAKRVYKYYRKQADVIYPPVDVANYQVASKTEDYFLIVSRLVPYKQVGLALEAFNQLGLPLKIIGDGPEFKKLQKLAKPNVELLGALGEADKRELLAKCKAFIFPPEEDFGISPIEAMAAGRPVIAFGKGGALETIIPGKTGVFFYEQTVDALIRAVKDFVPDKFDSKIICKQAAIFDRNIFKQKFQAYVQAKMAAS
ncbi:MAG TPA: glycosyltransferase family 4 protein [Candidatus Wirthbacteria bacterium]|nr:glycosyltransferase family 4 protein [Candidatus Wirthbacteria bacterium]